MAEKRKDNKGRNLRTGESQRKDGRYMYRWTQNGKERSVYALTLGELREKEEEIRADIREGIDGKTASALTVDGMFKKYMESEKGIRLSTKLEYQRRYDCFIYSVLGKSKINKVKYSDVKSFYHSIIEEKGLSYSSICSINIVLNSIFKLAVKDNIIRNNPCEDILHEFKGMEKYTKKVFALTVQEQNAFISYISNSNVYNHYLPVFMVMFGTGCRVGELGALTWDDIDFNENIIKIRKTLHYKIYESGKCEYHINRAKTRAGERDIPMLREIRKKLMSEKKRQLKEGFWNVEVDGFKGFIFVTQRKNPYTSEVLNHAIKRICTDYNKEEKKKAKRDGREPVLIRNFTCHNIRHTFATRICENETNLKAIQDIMGHKDIKTTMNIYAEATKEVKQKSIDSLEGKFKLT